MRRTTTYWKITGLLLVLLLPLAGSLPQNSPPQVTTPFAGDPRLEPLPQGPVNLAGFSCMGGGVPVTLHFPPRVNGQNEGDGSRHSDMWVLFNASTGQRVNQPPILKAVPNGAAGTVSDLTARLFSSTWALHAVTVSASYDPTNVSTRIDSSEKIQTSGFVITDYQTSIFVNAPVVPNGSTIDPGTATPMQAFYEGQTVTVVPYDVEDGALNPQTMFRFVDPSGAVLGAPYLVLSHIPTDPFFSPIWEVWTVKVPFGFDVTTIKSEADVQSSGFSITSAGTGIRIDAPVVAVNGTSVPVENALSFLSDSNGNFNPAKFPFDVPASTYTRQRTFTIVAVTPHTGAVAPAPTASFPVVDPAGKGNVIPLILQDPLQLLSSGPNSTGTTIRIDQADLDSAYNNNPPQLPPAIEANFATLVNAGLLTPDWAPNGTHAYQERLALIGRAFFELVWKPEQGANPKDVTSCHACHSRPASAGVARGQYVESGGVHPGNMWGGGSEELLVSQLKAAGVPDIVSAHGSRGGIPTFRSDINGAFFAHMGMQSSELAAELTLRPGGSAPRLDLDGDGVANELSVGEVTAVTVYLMTLPLPAPASPQALGVLGITQQSVQNGAKLFRTSIDNGGTGCATCHRPFYSVTTNTFQVTNPQTSSILPLQLPFNSADADDVADGLAQSVGQMGLRLWGDIKLHTLGALDIVGGTSSSKSTELWGAGSVYPYLRDGHAGGNLDAAIDAHEGVYVGNISISRGKQINTAIGGKNMSSQLITITNLSSTAIAANANSPIHVILTGSITPGITAVGATAASDGTFRQGAYFLIKQSIPANGNAEVLLRFANPGMAPLQYNLAVQDDAGFSESVASVQAYNALPPQQQDDVDNLMRAQLVGDLTGEQ
jgi:hypothetical protein